MKIAYKKGEEPLAVYFRHQLLRLKIGLVVAITGNDTFRTGAGKSFTAIQLARQIDPDFNIKKIVYKPEQFLDVLDYVQKSGKKGQVVVIDEGGVTMGSGSSYHTLGNKAMALTLQTFRNLNCMAIFCVPNFSDLDIRARRLVSHQGWATKEISQNGNLHVYLDMRRLTMNMFNDDGRMWKHKIQMYSKEHKRLITFDKFLVAKIPKYASKPYEAMATEFKKELRMDFARTLQYEQGKDKLKSKVSVDEVVDSLSTDESKLLDCMSSRGTVDSDMIKHVYNVTSSDARIIKKIVDTKIASGEVSNDGK